MANALNRVVAIPNWSFFEPSLAEEAAATISTAGVTLHYCRGDVDHQRTVIAFSGDEPRVFAAATMLAHKLLPQINLQIHAGVHPRIGALDVMPFVLIEGSESELVKSCRRWAKRFFEEFKIPVHLYEKAALEGQEHRLPYLRGQMGGVVEPLDLQGHPHPQWGVSIVGVRDFLLATNIDVDQKDPAAVKQVAREIRNLREQGDSRFAGVRSLGFVLPSREMSQLSLNLTQPDATSFDDLYDFCDRRLHELGAQIVGTELIGVIRPRDVERATHLTVEPSQVVS